VFIPPGSYEQLLHAENLVEDKQQAP